MSSICIIPARGGSKRIPRKNIKNFHGIPIIAYSIKTALDSGLFNEVMVSTDDKEIAEISKKNGAVVPFYRSKTTSNDFAGIPDVLVEVITKYISMGREFDSICCILPTAPFLTKIHLIESYSDFIANDFDTLIPIVKFSYPILRSFSLVNGKVRMNWPENYSKRSQDLEPAYHDAGMFYWLKQHKFLSNPLIFSGNSGAYELEESIVQDIDSEEDWKVAEFKYNYLKGRQ